MPHVSSHLFDFANQVDDYYAKAAAIGVDRAAAKAVLDAKIAYAAAIPHATVFSAIRWAWDQLMRGAA